MVLGQIPITVEITKIGDSVCQTLVKAEPNN